jgi:hypothetical protein
MHLYLNTFSVVTCIIFSRAPSQRLLGGLKCSNELLINLYTDGDFLGISGAFTTNEGHGWYPVADCKVWLKWRVLSCIIQGAGARLYCVDTFDELKDTRYDFRPLRH